MSIMRRILGSWYDNSIARLVFEILFIVLPIAFMIRTFFFGLYQVPSESMETTLLVGERFFADKLTYWFRKPKHGEIIAFNAPDIKVCPEKGYAYSKNSLVNLFERYVWGPQNWTKRVIGIPGDHIVGKIENGHPVIYRNDVLLKEPYVNIFPLIALSVPYTEFGDCLNRSYVLRSYDPAKSWQDQEFYNINPKNIIAHDNEPVIIKPGTPIDQDIFDVKLGDNQYWVMGDNRLGSGDSRMWGILDGKQIHGRIVFRIWSMDTEESWWILDLIRHPIDFWKKVRWKRCLQFVSGTAPA